LKNIKNNFLKINFNFITNFSPSLKIKSEIYLKKIKTKNKTNCKHFILFTLILKNIFKKNKISIFIKPKKFKIFNILRAPYKNKNSKHQITFSRFFLNVSIKIFLKNIINFINIYKITFFLNNLKKYYSFFESNICFQHKSKICFFFYLNDFFFI